MTTATRSEISSPDFPFPGTDSAPHPRSVERFERSDVSDVSEQEEPSCPQRPSVAAVFWPEERQPRGCPCSQISGPAQALGSGSADSVPWLRQHGDPPETYPGHPTRRCSCGRTNRRRSRGNGVGNQQVWEQLSTRLTPADNFFFVSHYGHPVIDPTTWRLGIDGLVARPGSLSLAAAEVTSTQTGGVHPGVLGQQRIPSLHRRRR